ncbi:glycosyltransferase [Melioribacter sp. Ez-97]|uniref:glycosyltransferase n=1 Tax=Melioribacter sp. Ez-97 TaxID=3423434 RepID=UPI003EDB1DFE
MVKISIASLIYKSKKFADWVYESVNEFTPMIKRGEAEFFFIANDPEGDLVDYLTAKGYKFYININPRRTEEELFKMGYAKPEYIHRVYRGWNEAIRKAQGDLVVLVNSDNYFSPDWLENLIKYSSPNSVVCSQLVERKHPKHGIFPGAYHGEFGDHPTNFKKDEFLSYANKVRSTGIKEGGAYMPCMLFKDVAMKAGLYPEGNIAGKSFDDVAFYGDEYFFDKLAKLGVKHITSFDSIVYHMKEGEMDEASTSYAMKNISENISGIKGDSIISTRELEESLVKLGEMVMSYEDNVEEAERYFKRVLEINANNTEALNNLGVIEWNRGNRKNAREFLQKSYELDRHNRVYVLNYLEILKAENNIELAVNIIDRYLESHPDDSELKAEYFLLTQKE